MTPSNASPSSDRPSLRELLAARGAGGSAPSAPGNPTREELVSHSVQELRWLARELGLTGYSQNRKAELVNRLLATERATRSRAPRKAAATKPAAKSGNAKPARETAARKPAAPPSTAKPAAKAPRLARKTATRNPTLEAASRKSAPKAFAPKPKPKAITPKSTPKAISPKATPKALDRKAARKARRSKPALPAPAAQPAPVSGNPPVSAPTPPMPPPTEFARSPLGPPAAGPLPPIAPPPRASAIEEGLPRHIPWGYGRDRVTAMAVDPEELYVYAEITDQGLEHGRRALGVEGASAQLVLRVHDVTGRIFDGTNSLGFLDRVVDRGQRGWFLGVARPGSTAIVEMGLRSESGRFHKIARSRRVDFARLGSQAGATEWMTVVATPGGRPEPVIRARGSGHPAAAPTHATPHFDSQPAALAVVGDFGAPEEVEWIPAPHLDAFVGGETFTYDIAGPAVPGEAMTWGWLETWPLEGLDHRESRWFVSPEGWSWIGGPYERWSVTGPVTIWEVHGDPEYFEGPEGHRIRYGRWSVEIKGIAGWAERRLLGRWSVSQSWEVAGGAESIAWQGSMSDPRLGGSSDLRWQGASERRWRGASELRLGGASEMIRRGASELRLGGASELIRRGASERRFGYGSEQRWLGASERRQQGGSERRLGGASERRRPARPGGSEGRFPGASERRLGGASERHATRPPRRDDDIEDRRG